MNNILPYEEQIAGKLAALPLPGLQDAIWARIETMLDADDALDSNAIKEEKILNEVTEQVKILNKKTIAVLVIIALIISIIILKKQRNKQPQPKQPDITIILPPQSSDIKQKDSVLIKPVIADIQKAKLLPDDTIQQSNNSIDTSVMQVPLLLNPPVADSTVKKEAREIIPAKKDSVIKKPKGVPGISDSDYKLKAVAKDSIKQ